MAGEQGKRQRMPGFHTGAKRKGGGATMAGFAAMRERRRRQEEKLASDEKDKGRLSPAREKLVADRETRFA